MRRRVAVLAPATAGLLASCSSGGGSQPSTAAVTHTATIASRSGSSQQTPASTTTAAADPLAGCPAMQSLASLPALARVPGDDDDLIVTSAGNIWLSLHANRRLVELDSTGHTLRTLSDPGGPEGIVELPDGRLLVGEQLTNRIDAVDPASGSHSVLATLPGASGEGVGVDGLGFDRARSLVLVPDSPAGTLLTLPLSGGVPTTRARGLGRPVAADVLSDGTLLVGAENAPGLSRVDANGQVTAVVAPGVLRSVDEVLVRNGVVYVTDLVAGTLDAVDPATGRVRVLVNRSPAPQGLALTSDGRLLLTDSTDSEIVAVPTCR